jgi:hypothetical protein
MAAAIVGRSGNDPDEATRLFDVSCTIAAR